MKKITKIYPLLPMFVGLTPLLASAADALSIIRMINDIVNVIIPLFMTIAVAVFLYGIILYITAGGDEAKEKEARGYIIYGIIGLFALVAFWGLVTVISNTFAITEGATPITPEVMFEPATT